MADSSLSVGKLLDLQWKLGVGIESSNCKKLSLPFVTVKVTVLDSNGKITTDVFEMTLAQFKDFSRGFKDISNLLESL